MKYYKAIQSQLKCQQHKFLLPNRYQPQLSASKPSKQRLCLPVTSLWFTELYRPLECLGIRRIEEFLWQKLLGLLHLHVQGLVAKKNHMGSPRAVTTGRKNVNEMEDRRHYNYLALYICILYIIYVL